MGMHTASNHFRDVFHAFDLYPKATDAVCIVGATPRIRIDGDLVDLKLPIVTVETMDGFFGSLPEKHREVYLKDKSADLSYEDQDMRFRLNIAMQRGTCALYIRRISSEIPKLAERFKNDAATMESLLKKRQSFIVISGPSGAGKTTTLAVCVNYIKEVMRYNIVSIEDPIEFLHRASSSIVSQREVGQDVNTFYEGIKQALRQTSDVVVVGEMRDKESLAAALGGAETGRLLLTTVHAYSVQDTISRMVGLADKDNEDGARRRIADALSCVISQRLVLANGEKQLVYEMVIIGPAERNLIRQGEEKSMNTQINLQRQPTLGEKLKRMLDKNIITKEEYDSQVAVDIK